MSPSPACRAVTAPAFSCLKSVRVTIGATKGRTTMGRSRRSGPEEALEKAVGRLAEGTAKVTGDESLEAEGRTMRRKGERKT